MAVYNQLNTLSGMIPSNPCDIARLADLSRTCEMWIPRCMNALAQVLDNEAESALETMEP